MFRNPANSIIRLVFFPVILLFYQQYHGVALPILAPIFVVIFLTIMPSKPPLNMLLKLLLVLMFVSFGVVFLGGLLIDTPTGYALFCWSMLFWCFYRSHHDPKDLISTLVIMVVIIMTVMSVQLGAPIDVLPWLMFEAFVVALLVTYLSFVIFPGDEQDILPDETSTEGAETHMGLIVFKATAMSVVLVALVGSGSAQSILIAITISSMIKIPNPEEHRTFSQTKIVTTAVGILFTLPLMFLFRFGVATWVLLGVTIFLGLQLACFAIRRQCTLTIYQLLFTNFVVLVYQVIKQQGSESLSAEFMRLVSIVISVLIGALILNLTKHKPVLREKIND
ncbi:DUF2955 domain-containing protein [Shewanella psychrotolerans]|uniref:DUF2955 domain-containing protein n=1 Tax=Shewanella psychrotolerans TaxID=2864206 RepID=UPI001C656770|nr:DUF2955 domain-containing protein [Shewanella psychrotolerans]QYJ99848.1 DUF2955 domain-containing protein [Shewanella psychrotolerans]